MGGGLIAEILVWIVPLLAAIVLHEVAHGMVACVCGEPTAARLGRLTPNPLPHLDPVGSFVLPGLARPLVGFFLQLAG